MTTSRIGFGAYRVSIKSQEHNEALKYALENGCNLIDTSSNYTDGDSEELIGKVLSEGNYDVTLITKAGYIQGQNFDRVHKLNLEGKATEELVKVQEGLWHSIHPDFLEDQLESSLNRLKVKSIDVFLLHNPEYYFYEEGSNQQDYYKRIEKAFIFLEEKVKEGKIKAYGISSNNFVKSPSESDVTNLEEVLEIASKIENCHFKYIQFPFNFIETGAMEKYYPPFSLIEKAKMSGLITLVNRPLNGFKDNKLIRLASYDHHVNFISKEDAKKQFDHCMSLIEKKWKEEEHEEDVFEIPILKQFSELWDKLQSQDGAEQVYFGHLFPLIARIWGGEGLNAKEAEPFYELFDVSCNLARQNMQKISDDFKEQAIKSGLIELKEGQSLQLACVSKYLEMGIDHVLLGMKRKSYIDEMKELF